MQVKNFKDLTVWQKSMDLVIEIYQLVKEMPKEEAKCFCLCFIAVSR
ncbi:MAG: four helix bundle protein [Clostridia bacterium]|nr:four helix bundle protein [Clostridia bacterium]